MKILGIIGTIVGAIAGILGGYLQFVLVPAADIAESRWRMATSDAYFGSLEHQLDMSTMSAATDFGVIVMGAGLLAFFEYCSCDQKAKNCMDWCGSRSDYVLPWCCPWNTHVQLKTSNHS